MVNLLPMKAIEKAQKAAIFLSALPFVILMRIIRPLIRIRLVDLNAARIGHLIINTELYLAERDAGMYGPRGVDIFYYSLPVSNRQLLKMWKRVITVADSHFLYWIAWANRKIPGWEMHESVKAHGNCDVHGIVDMSKQRISFTQDEKDHGEKDLRAMGIPDDKPFICFHARDSAYLARTYPEKDWSYHNYRNVEIENYRLAVQRLIDRGYHAVRMGSIVEKRFSLTAPGVIDYACGQMRSDLLDLYLLSKCHFFINSENGIGAVSRLFRRPAVCVNQIPMDHMAVWDPNYIVICKKLWLKADKRFLTFREILKSKIGRFVRSEDYERDGIEIVQNSPEEIWDVVEEMLKRLEGSWKTDDYSEELQRRFWSLYEPNELHGVIKARMGSKFLEQNKNLLD